MTMTWVVGGSFTFDGARLHFHRLGYPRAVDVPWLR